MKKEELMLNDIVDTCLTTNGKKEAIKIDCTEMIAKAEFLYPIKINENTLLYNKFKKENKRSLLSIYSLKRKGMIIKYNFYSYKISITKGCYLIVDIEIKYIHQLQHVLRLVGLNKVADSITIIRQ